MLWQLGFPLFEAVEPLVLVPHAAWAAAKTAYLAASWQLGGGLLLGCVVAACLLLGSAQHAAGAVALGAVVLLPLLVWHAVAGLSSVGLQAVGQHPQTEAGADLHCGQVLALGEWCWWSCWRCLQWTPWWELREL